MIFVPGTSAKPARAAFPVSPDVAVRITISFVMLFFFAAVVRRYGRIESAISLNAMVEPWNNSSAYASPTLTSGTISSVSNFESYAPFIQCINSSFVKSVRNLLITV